MTVISFLVRGDGDSFGDFYSPVLTVMGRNILIIVERGQKNVGGKITHESTFLVETVTKQKCSDAGGGINYCSHQPNHPTFL